MATCYRKTNGGSITSFVGVHVCGNSTSTYSSCCFNGHECLADGLCYAPVPATGTTGFYEALCSDPKFSDASCSKKCTAYTKGDAVYDSSIDEWKCCGTDSSGAAACLNPTNVTFAAPAPDVLLAQATASTSSASSSATSVLATSTTLKTTSTSGAASSSSTSTSTTLPVTNDSSDSGMSTGAKAGIAIGVALGVLAVGGIAFWFVFGRKRRQRHDRPAQVTTTNYFDHNSTPAPYYDNKSQFSSQVTSPLPPYAAAAEMPGTNDKVQNSYYGNAHPTVHEMSG